MKSNSNGNTALTGNENDVQLSESISLIGELAKKINNISSDYLGDDGVPKSMKLILQCLVRTDGVSQLDIVRFTGFKAPTVSVMIHKMESLGYVHREPDKYDLRAMKVFITPAGREIYNEAVSNVKAVESKVLSGITKEQTESLVVILRKINENLENI